MNIKITSLTFLVAAIASVSLSQQAAHAGGGPNSRFQFAANEYALEQPTGRRGNRYPGAHVEVAPIAAGVAPKMKGFDDGFVSKPAPPPAAPVVAAAPIARPSVSAQVKAPSLFNSLFNPVKTEGPGLVANAPGKLDFGHPNALPVAPTPKMPTLAHSTNTAIKLMTPQHRHPVVAMHAPEAFKMPAILKQGGGYTPTGNIPIATNTGSSASTNVQGVLMSKHH